MNDNIKQILNCNCVLRGTINKGKENETIFQTAHFGQQIYSGPKIPQNPRVQNQQLQRLQFKRAILIAGNLTQNVKDHLIRTIPADKPGLSWRTFFLSIFMKRRKYGEGFYGAGIYSPDNPPQKIKRYGTTAFGDGFYSRTNSLPRPRQYNSDVYGSHYMLT